MRNYYKDYKIFMISALIMLGIVVASIVVGIILDYDFFDYGVDKLFICLAAIPGIGALGLLLFLVGYLIYFKAIKKETFYHIKFFGVMLLLALTIGLAFLLVLAIGLAEWASAW